jgi:regulator of PEP synthase PpsR (kinase-PPPase family)
LLLCFVADIGKIWLARVELENGLEAAALAGSSVWGEACGGDTSLARINATNYALAHDDGVDVNYDDAEVILVGVSRSGKTPTCLYLALHYGVRAANYPLTEEDLEGRELPRRLRSHRRKLFALTIDPSRLQQVREARRPGSSYSKLEQCRSEVIAAEALFRQEDLPQLSTTHTSIEEIASKIMSSLGIQKHFY